MRSDSFLQPWWGQRTGQTWPLGGCSSAHLLYKSIYHQLLMQLNISTAGLPFLPFLPLFVVVARCGFTVICSAHSSLQDADVGRDA